MNIWEISYLRLSRVESIAEIVDASFKQFNCEAKIWLGIQRYARHLMPLFLSSSSALYCLYIF